MAYVRTKREGRSRDAGVADIRDTGDGRRGRRVRSVRELRGRERRPEVRVRDVVRDSIMIVSGW